MADRLYDNPRWEAVREKVLARDHSCVLSWLGKCSGPLHVHHTRYDDPYNEDYLAVVCEHHHGTADHLRRYTARWKSCPHKPGTHRYPGAREACERQLNRSALN